jgi:hypothetical protein
MIECPIPEWRPDEVAECLNVSFETRKELWRITTEIDRAGKKVPLGGDGTNGTVELPPEPDAYPDGRMRSVWPTLTDEQRADITAAYAKEYGIA